MNFDPKKYWQERDNPNARGHDSAPSFIYDFLRPRLAGKTDILEVGPGVGRTFDVYTPDQVITTVDLSSNYNETLTQKAQTCGVTLEQHFLDSPHAPFPFENLRFEAGVCVQVLMHVPPEYIDRTLGELFRTSRHTLIVTTTPPEGTHAPHVFSHDYEALVAKHGRNLIERIDKAQTACLVIN